MSQSEIVHSSNADLAVLHFFINTFRFLWRDKWREARAERRAEEANSPHRLAELGLDSRKMLLQKLEKETYGESDESFKSSRNFLIVSVPTAEERAQFQKYLEQGSLEVENNKVYVMYPVKTGETFRAGSINLENGWVVSDFPYGRMSGFPLYIAREIAGWSDPTGVSHVLRENEPDFSEVKGFKGDERQPSLAKDKKKHPHAPTSRKHRRFKN